VVVYLGREAPIRHGCYGVEDLHLDSLAWSWRQGDVLILVMEDSYGRLMHLSLELHAFLNELNII